MFKETTYKFFSEFIFQKSGINYEEKNWFQLDSRITSLMKYAGVTSEEELLSIIKNKSNPELNLMAVDLATNNETFFFRDKKLFDIFEKVIFPQMISSGKMFIDLWSLASSTGQEAYSLQMTWDKSGCGQKGAVLNIQCSDISPRVLARAKEGKYTQLEIQRGLTIFDTMKYFEQLPDGHWKAKDSIKKNMSFGEFNLLTSNYPINKYDVVCCRNVLIYQTVENRKKIVKQIFGSIKKDGVLVLGNSENVIGLSDDFTVEIIDGCSIFRRAIDVKRNAA